MSEVYWGGVRPKTVRPKTAFTNGPPPWLPAQAVQIWDWYELQGLNIPPESGHQLAWLCLVEMKVLQHVAEYVAAPLTVSCGDVIKGNPTLGVFDQLMARASKLYRDLCFDSLRFLDHHGPMIEGSLEYPVKQIVLYPAAGCPMLRSALMLAAMLLPMTAQAETWTSKKDSSGYTHYRSSKGVTGTSKTDSSGYTHYRFSDGKKCTAKTDSSGYTRTNCR